MKTKIIFPALFFFGVSTAFSPLKNIHSKEVVTVNPALPSGVKSVTASNFEFFRTHRQGKAAITATWGITAPGNDVSGFIVEKTYEDPTDPYANWELVSAMPNSGGKSFKCTDNNVFPGFISYKVTAILIAGGSYVSPVSTVHIVSH